MLNTAKQIIKKINNFGFDAYIVGGAVRDFIMNREIRDVDIATNAPVQILKDNFNFINDVSKNMNLGVYIIEQNGFKFEIANFRIDGISKDHRKPEEIIFSNSFKRDASRRDFTINAMGMDYRGNIIDFFDGKSDIEHNILRTVGCSFDRFGEDFLRILRAIRFAAKYNLKFDRSTAEAIKMCEGCLNSLSPERIQCELEKMASEGGIVFANAIQLMEELNILKDILPEMDKLFHLQHSKKHHPEGLCRNNKCKFFQQYQKLEFEDLPKKCKKCKYSFNSVGKHIIESLKLCSSTDINQLFAVAFHDIGKSTTYKLREKHGVLTHTYYGHDIEAEEILNKIADRLRWSNTMREITIFCAKNHMLFHKIGKELKGFTLLSLMENRNFKYLIETSYCDDASRKEIFNLDEWNKKLEYVKQFEKIFEFSKKITGKRILDLTKINPGPRIGKIIKAVKKYVANNKITNEEILDKKIIEYVKMIKK